MTQASTDELQTVAVLEREIDDDHVGNQIADGAARICGSLENSRSSPDNAGC